VADDNKIEVIERTSISRIIYYTVLINGWVHLITTNKDLVKKFIKKGNYNGR
jgi:hypothetical protein